MGRRPSDKRGQTVSVGFEAWLRGKLSGPAGTEMRRAHLLEEIANRIFGGDLQKAQQAMATQYPALGDRSPHDAAETYDGMLDALEFIDNISPAQIQPKGLGAFLGAVRESWRVEFEPLLDLLPAAWGMSDDEFELLLRVPSGWLRAWRNHEVTLNSESQERLRRLRKFHEAMRLVVTPQGYAETWRRTWRPQSPIGERSPWEAYQQDRDAALDNIELYFRAQR